jgi:arylsulfatase A-like enzyme
MSWKHRIALACLLVIFGVSFAADGADRPPNVVFIMADDLGWTDVGCFGSDYHHTPHIDALAASGMKFTSAYASPNCAPTRACLMSGQYTPRHGIYTVQTGARGEAKDRKLIPAANKTVLSLDIPTWAELVREAGYFTAHLGKWHLGDPPRHGPRQQGFDVNVAGFRAGTPPGGYFVPYRNPHLPDGPEGEYLTDRLVDETIKLIHDHWQRPFFIYLPHYAPHTPIQAKEEIIAKYQQREPGEHHDNARYAAMIYSVDEGVGRIMATLKELEIDDHTIVIFYSDNGVHERFSNAQPLRAGKGSLYEGGVRVPLIVRWPGVTEPGSVCDEPVQHVDFYPTFLEITGGTTPPDHVIDGQSFVPLLKSGGEGRLDREAIFWHFPGYLEGYLQNQQWRTTPATAMRARDWKLIEYFEDGRVELYHLSDDISEQHDLASELPAKRDALHSKMIAWRKVIAAPLPSLEKPDG